LFRACRWSVCWRDPGSFAYAALIKEAQDAARGLGIKLLVQAGGAERDIDAAFAKFAQQPVGALLVNPSTYFNWDRRDQIVRLAAGQAIPAIYSVRPWVTTGGLMSYGTVLTDTYHQVGIYAAKTSKVLTSLTCRSSSLLGLNS
jgi:putative ABC transport system substrate-binding protein